MSIPNPPVKPFLNRYTTLPVLLDILLHKKLVLLSPSTWEDRNDAYYMERYKAEKKLKTVLALCFSKKRETFHHWKIFTGGSGGVCIEFDKNKLVKKLRSYPELKGGSVKYYLINEAEKQKPVVDRWPFMKRKPFEDEGEYRIVYENKREEIPAKEIPIQLDFITSVVLSPWMPLTVAESVKSVIRGMEGCRDLKVVRSSLLETKRWKAVVS